MSARLRPPRDRRLLPATFAGMFAALAGRALLGRMLERKFRRDVRALNAGDPGPILANYVDSAVLQFNDGPHRWAGEHHGRAAIAAFLDSFIAAGLQGEITEIAFSGPPWRMTLMARFDDRALDERGEIVYRNRAVLLVRTRWGRIVRHEDFYEDTGRIDEFDVQLAARGL